MFCPECKSEFIEGIYRCNKCNVDLVNADFLTNKINEYVDFKELLTIVPALGGGISDLAFIKMLLEHNGIKYFCNDEFISRIYYSAIPVKIMVDSIQYNEAVDLLKDLKLNCYFKLGRKTDSLVELKYKCPNCNIQLNSDTDECPECQIEIYECTDCNGYILETEEICPHCHQKFEN